MDALFAALSPALFVGAMVALARLQGSRRY
jgi:hypothetical protein